MTPTTFINPFAKFGAVAISNKGDTGPNVAPTYLWSVYNAKAGLANPQGPSIDGMGAGYAAYKASLPTGTLASVTVNNGQRMFGPRFPSGGSNTADAPTDQEIYSRWYAECLIVNSAGVDMFIMDDEWNAAAGENELHAAVIVKAIRDACPNVTISAYLAHPENQAQAAAWPANTLAQMSMYGADAIDGDSDLYNRKRTALSYFSNHYSIAGAEKIQAIAYVGTLADMGTDEDPSLIDLLDLYLLALVASGGIVDMFDQNDDETNQDAYATWATAVQIYNAATGGVATKRITSIVADAYGETYAVAQLQDGSLVAAYLNFDRLQQPRAIDNGIGGKMIVLPPTDDSNVSVTRQETDDIPRYEDAILADETLLAYYPLNESSGDFLDLSKASAAGVQDQPGLQRSQPGLITNKPGGRSIKFPGTIYSLVKLDSTGRLRTPHTTVMFFGLQLAGGDTSPTMYSSMGGGDGGLWIRRQAAAGTQCAVYMLAGGGFKGPALFNLPFGEGHQVAVTYDGQAICAYVDGVLSGSWAFVGALQTGPGEVVIGDSFGPFSGNRFSGQMEGVGVFSEAMTAERVGYYAALASSEYIINPKYVAENVDRGDGVLGTAKVGGKKNRNRRPFLLGTFQRKRR